MIELHNTDCREIMANIKTGSIDCIITDPPYYSTELHFDKAPRIDFEAWLKECQRVLKPHGVLVSFADFNLLAELRRLSPFKSTYELIWRKKKAVGFLDVNVRPLRAHEFIGIFVDGLKKSTYNPQKTEGEAYVKNNRDDSTSTYKSSKGVYTNNNNGDRHPVSVLEFGLDSDEFHPTQKPLDAISWLLKTYSNEGDTVLDCFMGSGTTGHACMLLNRNFIGVELDKTYFDIAEKRILDANHNIFNL
jgi:site-specific DNA-methyltransferase (adenine-specific)